MPAQPLPKSLASPGLLAYVATAKYADALPLYRRHQQLKRIGVDLSRTTLATWMVNPNKLPPDPPPKARLALRRIQTLYAIERRSIGEERFLLLG